jgi:hypothetical protein
MKKSVEEEVIALIKDLDLNCTVKRFKDKVDWEWISIHQNLSEGFIRELKNEVDWCYISIYQNISKDFIKEFNLETYLNN